HQTITVTLGYELSKLELGPVLEPLLVLGGTMLACAMLYEFVIRRVALLRPLFGVPPGPQHKPAEPAGAAAQPLQPPGSA
ncbi:MAG: acyltransferase, partial [Pseudomonadota bacterium]